MELQELLELLEATGTEQTRKTWRRHGAETDEMFGVLIGDMKKIISKYKLQRNSELARKLYATNILDAMYMAGIMINPKDISADEIEDRMRQAQWKMIYHHTIPMLAANSGHALPLAKKWLEKDNDKYLSTAYALLSSYMMITDNKLLDIPFLEEQLQIILATIHQEKNWTKYYMNQFVIVLATSVPGFYEIGMSAANTIGQVSVDVGDTSCQIPDAETYIQKTTDRYGKGGLKKKKITC